MDSNPAVPLDPYQKFLKNVKGLMLGRIIILSLLLAITFVFQILKQSLFFLPLTNAFYYFIGFFYLVTIVYAVLLKTVRDLRRFTALQILLDHFFIIGLVYFTGGRESPFPVTFIFSIISSSMIFYLRGALLSASLSSLLYGLLLLLQFHGLIHPLGETLEALDPSQIFYSLILHLATFYIVAFLSSTLSEELRKKKRELIQKQDDYNQLETFNRNIIQSLDSGLLTTDLEGKINFLNRTAERILSLSGDELKGRSVHDLFPDISEVIQESSEKGPGTFSDYQRYETLFKDSQGRNLHLGFSISPLTGTDGSLMGHTLIFQDITRFKEMEEQMKRIDKMAAVGQLAAGMAHEIRNPLTSLSGSIQVLRSELPLDHSGQRLMTIILRESERLNALITDFLLFAQPPKTNRSLWQIGTVMDETLELFLHSPEYREGIEIVRTDATSDLRVMMDPDQMRQVFWNLLINAAQAMSNGGTLRIQMEKTEDGLGPSHGIWGKPPSRKRWVKVSISDSGVGIAPAEKEKIFEPFYSTKEGGTGLGLSIVHRIIENHQGLIKVESEVGKGATFSIFLPIEEKEKKEW